MSSKNSLIETLRDCSLKISQSENGNVEASKDLFRQISIDLKKDIPLRPEVRRWLSEKLAALADGENPTATLNLKRPPGNPKKHCSEEIQRLIAETVRDAPGGLHKGSNLDGSKKGAYLEAAAMFGIAENTAEKYYKNQIDRIILEEQIAQEIRDEIPD